MNDLRFIGSFSSLLLDTFGNTLKRDFINKNLPFIIYDYDEMKRNCSDICAKLNYESVDRYAYALCINKWRKIYRDYNQDNLDIDNLQKVDY